MRSAADFDALTRRQRYVARGALWLLGLLTALYFVFLVPRVRSVVGSAASDLLLVCIYLLGAVIVGARAALVREARWAWAAVAVGMLSYFGGNLYFAVALQFRDPIPFPSLADALWLAFYPLTYAAVVLLLRRQITRWHASVWFDGLVAALGVGALAVTFVLGQVTRTSDSDFATVAMNLAYPVADLLLVTLIAGVFATMRWRPSRSWWLLALGLAAFCVADAILLLRATENWAYQANTWLDGVWLVGIVAMAAAAWSRDTEQVRASLEGWVLLAIPMSFALVAVGLLVFGSTDDSGMPVVASALAGATIVVALMRTVLTFRELRALADARRQARTDELTGLANRRHFLERLEGALATRGDNEKLAVLLVDLDGFKEINDSFGHQTGDELLRLVGPRLENQLGPNDLVARLGGDEFGLLLLAADVTRASAVAQAINARLREPFVLDGMPLRTDGSVGIALCPEHGSSSADFLQYADLAMYTAKAAHSGYAVYEPGDSDESRQRLQTLEELREALDRGQMMVHYQPKLDLHLDRVTGAEALVRWKHPVRGILYPDAFLPLAEQAGLMRQLAMLVLEHALRDLGAWHEDGHDLTVAVNLSASDLLDVGLPDQVELLLTASGVAPESLTLEITENILVSDADRAHEVLAGLRRLGVTLSVDDYGTGYSSLAYLRALPVQELKLDRSFVSHLDSDQRSAAIVENTVDLSRRLGLTMVAEGIENAAVLEQLRDWGCDVGQGYHIARPMPADRFLDWLARHDVPVALPLPQQWQGGPSPELSRGPAPTARA